LGLELGFTHMYFYAFIYEHKFRELVTLYCLSYEFWRIFFNRFKFSRVGIIINTTFDTI